MNRPPDHPLRAELGDEVHARPPESLRAPARISYLALISDPATREQERTRLAAFAAGAAPPAGGNHLSADLGTYRLKWEGHTEFSRYTFIVDGAAAPGFGETALDLLPPDLVSSLPGQVIAAAHVALLPAGDRPEPDAVARLWFSDNVLVGADVGAGAATAYTDFRIHPDGFSRFVVQDRTLAPRQAGRLIQRLLEIETYKTLALLALPVARGLVPFLKQAEEELAAITTRLAEASDADEALLLERLTRLEAGLESRGADSLFRFGASSAYYGLVGQRIAELRETRIEGLQTFGEFVERRLAPAMNTCLAASRRQEELSARVARANQLLSTRVDVTRSNQTQLLLQSMNRRAKLQLRLQQTVEGLSVAAVTYYIVGLLGYAAKGLKPAGIEVNPDLAMAAAIPVVLLLTALGVRHIRRGVHSDRDDAEDPA